MPQSRHVCECELPGDFYTGVPGIVALNENGRVTADSVVERCDLCQRYPTDLAALGKLRELGLIAGDSAPGNEQSFTVHCYALVRVEFPGVVAADRDSAARRVRERFDWDVHGGDAQIVEEAELAVFVGDEDVSVAGQLGRLGVTLREIES